MQYLSSTYPFGRTYQGYTNRRQKSAASAFDNFFFPLTTRASSVARTGEAVWKAPTNIYELENAYNVEIDLPGVAKDAVTINVEDSVLTVEAQISDSYDKVDKDSEDSTVKTIRSERFSGTVKRSFTLSEDVNEDSISAKLDNGVLTITLAKREVEDENDKVKRIEVN